jgi:hypothetical protein
MPSFSPMPRTLATLTVVAYLAACSAAPPPTTVQTAAGGPGACPSSINVTGFGTTPSGADCTNADECQPFCCTCVDPGGNTFFYVASECSDGLCDPTQGAQACNDALSSYTCP